MAKQIFNVPSRLFREIEEKFHFNAYFLELKNYIIMQENESDTSNIPIGFNFIDANRKEVNKIFADLAAQGFKIIREKKIINVTNKDPIIIQRHGKIIYED